MPSPSTFGPVELTALIKPESHVEQQRHLFCGSYDACLEEAVEKGWTSWSCVRCAMFAGAEGQGDAEPGAGNGNGRAGGRGA